MYIHGFKFASVYMHTMDLCHSINYMLTEGSGNVNGLVTIQLIEWGGVILRWMLPLIRSFNS